MGICSHRNKPAKSAADFAFLQEKVKVLYTDLEIIVFLLEDLLPEQKNEHVSHEFWVVYCFCDFQTSP